MARPSCALAPAPSRTPAPARPSAAPMRPPTPVPRRTSLPTPRRLPSAAPAVYCPDLCLDRLPPSRASQPVPRAGLHPGASARPGLWRGRRVARRVGVSLCLSHRFWVLNCPAAGSFGVGVLECTTGWRERRERDGCLSNVSCTGEESQVSLQPSNESGCECSLPCPWLLRVSVPLFSLSFTSRGEGSRHFSTRNKTPGSLKGGAGHCVPEP